MRKYMFCSLILVAVLCIGYGTQSSRRKMRLSPVAAATIRNGLTHKMEVFALLGAPSEIVTQVPIRQPQGAAPLEPKYTASEIWQYSEKASEKVDAGATPASYYVTVFFEEHGVVLDCQTETGR